MCVRKILTYFNKSALIGVLVGAILVIIYNNIYEYTNREIKESSSRSRISNSVAIAANDDVEETKTPLSALRKLFEITECKTKPLETSFKQRGDFWVLYNYVKANKRFRCYESITYTTQGDYRLLDDLLNLVRRWKGPISVALFAPGFDFQVTVNSIAYLRNCEIPLIRDYVTFHIFFGTKHLPQVNEALNTFYVDTYNCSLGAPHADLNYSRTYRSRNNLPYPVNVARNIARETAQTYFIFAADIDLYPTRFFIEMFLSMVEKRADLFRKQSKKVFALPIFEIVETANVPENKTYLKKMLRDGTASLFRSGICPQCHKVINADKWITADETEGLDVLIMGKRKGLNKHWEPFFVGTQADPLFHEEFNLDNQRNKMTQGFAMCLLDYDFMVLDNAFLIHKPGIKKKMEFKKQSEPDDRIADTLKWKLMTLLGRRDGCL